MARKNPHPAVSRRKFLAGVAVAGAATSVAKPEVADAAAPPVAAERVPAVRRPTAQQIAAETELPKVDSPLGGRAGSDFMIDVIKSLGIEYCYANPASSYRGIHESLINYGKNTMPEFITCMHEESAIAMAHGYFKVAGKPAMSLCHGVVGLMHGTMGIYNAWVDRAPVIVVGGTDLDAANRPPGVPTIHSGQDINALVRDFTKWDDTPVSLPHFAQSMVRAYKFAMTPPYEPVMIALDAELQEMPVPERDRNRLIIPKYTQPSPPQADVAALRETAKILVNAQNPVIVADRVARTPEGLKNLIVLAELLQAPVVNQRGRMNFPNSHHLNQTPALYAQADVILGLEVGDFWNVVNNFTDNADNEGLGDQRLRAKTDAKLITINSVELNEKSNYQDFQRFQPVDIAMVGDAEASLPSLIEAVKMEITADKQAAYEKRGEAFKKAKAANDARFMQWAAVGWDGAPITTARFSAELWNAVKDHDWALVSAANGTSGWPERFFKIDKHYQWIGGSGGAGQGYGIPASVGAAHAHKAFGRLAVGIVGDGDSMYAPGALWTAVRHQIPLLAVIHNNRGYHQEVMHVQRMSNRRNRVANNGKDFGPLGTRIENPNIDYAALAKSMGMQAFGPVTDPSELGATLKKAVQVAKAGEPVLVDAVMQPR
jgi:thiamine pyrophosphate-dependent acetolactate synthase large subunit-like protein